MSGAPAATAVAVLGSGVWGAAFGGAIAAEQCPVIFWDKSFDHAQRAAAAAPHSRAVAALPEAVADAALVVVAVSSGGFADVLRQLLAVEAAEESAAAGESAGAAAAGAAGESAGGLPVLWLTKGFDAASGAPLYAVAADLLGARAPFGALSGPSFAAEVMRGLPVALTLAMNGAAGGGGEIGEEIRARLHRPHMRLYLTDDLIGACIGGAVKNIIAIAAGISDGLQFGESARAALISRGLAEMGALTEALGGRRDTLLGLCGVGDLALTCCSDLSRNRRLGLALAAGDTLEDTCEGKTAAAAASAIAAAHGLTLPLIGTVAAVLAGECTPQQAAAQLLARPPR